MELIDREALMRKHTAGPHNNKHDTAEELKHLLMCIEDAPVVNETPCEMFNKMQGLQRDYDLLLMRYTKKCKEHDDIKRTLDQTTIKLNDETERADALQRRCDNLEKSRQAWVMKCEALTGQLEEVTEGRERLKELAEDYLKSFYEENHLRNDLLVHPWKNLWNHIKAVLGIG